MTVVELSDLWQMYKIKYIINGNVSWENFWALKDISLGIGQSESVGIIGENGAGKSTLLKLIAGILKPDRGDVKVSGMVSGLLELGAGFQHELTGKDNIYLNAGMFGLSRKDIEAKYDAIAAFADVGKFINAPVKYYSQGMFVRLAFSIAIHVGPDILLIDDSLAVGDEYFQRKCIKRIFELKEQDKTIIVVTHDINMLKRLCTRAIFLKQGRIIKDDTVDKVVPFYAQTIGPREAVAVLKKDALGAVFNNGRLFLSWEGKLLTGNSGVYFVFYALNRWYASSQAEWEVKSEGENKIFAKGKVYGLGLTQIWSLELMQGNIIKWDIEIELEEYLEIPEAHINIMLTSEYLGWFTGSGSGAFPLIDDKNKSWQPLLEERDTTRCIGVDEEKDGQKKIPVLIFERAKDPRDSYAQILNTDYLAYSRVLQYKVCNFQNGPLSDGCRHLCFSGRIIAGAPDKKIYLDNVQDEFVLSDGKLKLVFNNGRLALFYDGINLTKPGHITACALINGKWRSSDLAQWEVKKQANLLFARGRWQDIGVTQIWEIGLDKGHSLFWKIILELEKEIEISQQYIRFTCPQDYKYYFSDYGKGVFPVNFLEGEIDVLQRCIPDGTIGITSDGNKLPVLTLEFPQGPGNFGKIINSDFYNKARILRIDKVEPDERMKFAPGRHSCFEIQASFDEGRHIIIDEQNSMIQDGKLSFIFDNGRGRIYWEGREVTKKLGLYTSLRSMGRWNDSSTGALWRTEKKGINTIIAEGKWLYLPVRQRWIITLGENNLLGLEVLMYVDAQIEIDRFQVNVMLPEAYRSWISDKQEGPFPIFVEDVDDDWSRVYAAEGDCVGVSKNIIDTNLPRVNLHRYVGIENSKLNIVNSDIYHRARVLQYLVDRKNIIPKGEYAYFSGKISIAV